MDNQKDIIRIVQQYLNNTFTEEEYNKAIDFMRRPDAEDLMEQWEKEGLLTNPGRAEELAGTGEHSESIDSQLNLSRLLNKIFEHENRLIKSKKKNPPISGLLKALVVILITGFLAWFLMDLANQPDSNGTILITKNTARGQKLTLTLPDGTTVQMNSESTLTFPQEFGKTRQIALKGEAFFMVTRDEKRPFLVKTAHLTTKVLGTSFNIKAFDKEHIEVTVASGKVKVEPSPQTEDETSPLKGGPRGVILTPNQQAIFNTNNNILKKRNINATDFIAWKEGILNFSEVRFQEVVRDLERWYGIDINIINPRLNECIVIGQYQHESLETILKSFKFLMEIEYEFNKDGVTIRGEGVCKLREKM